MERVGWYTEEDVLKDFGSIGDFGEAYIVSGENPPPTRHVPVEDEELLLRFGGVGNRIANHGAMVPDLQGITKMLRLVQDDGVVDDKEINKKPDDAFIIISKLDPNVNEFVPRKVSVPVTGSIVTKENDIASTTTTKIKIEDKQILSEEPEAIKAENSITICNKNHPQNEEDKIKLTSSLRSQILEASKCDTMQQKRRRNVAIAALMKLNSTPDSNSPISSSSPLKLCTPHYFESITPLQVSEVSEKIAIEQPVDTEPQINEETVSLNTHIYDKVLQSNSYVQESIKKVNKWLQKGEEKTEPKSPAIYFDAVSFKKKDSSKTLPVQKPKPEPVVTPQAYVFSDYASELAKTYEDRKKEKETATVKQMDIWEKLEYDLKKRDKLVRERHQQEQNGIESQSGDDSKPQTSTRSKPRRRR